MISDKSYSRLCWTSPEAVTCSSHMFSSRRLDHCGVAVPRVYFGEQTLCLSITNMMKAGVLTCSLTFGVLLLQTPQYGQSRQPQHAQMATWTTVGLSCTRSASPPAQCPTTRTPHSPFASTVPFQIPGMPWRPLCTLCKSLLLPLPSTQSPVGA